MAYDNPDRQLYTILGANLAAAQSRNIRGPKGRRGRVRRANLSTTTAVTAGAVLTVTTTVAPVPSSPTAPAGNAATIVYSWPIPAMAANVGASLDVLTKDANYFDYIVPADADVVLAIAPNGATGTVDLRLEILWF